jgi:3-phosphoshikimate 1-carboxyvinyltransferase
MSAGAPAHDVARILGGGRLGGRVRVPGDKSISHRALIFAALAEGTSEIAGLSRGDDVVRTATAMAALGAAVDARHWDHVVVDGGTSRLREAERPIDVGNSGTGLRLLAGVASRFPFLTVLLGDESIHRRPMGRIVAPLRQMGATIDGRDDGRLAPLVVRGGRLEGIDFTPPVPSAQVKSAVLLAGLAASGSTTVREKFATRRHTEEMLDLAGAPAEVAEQGGYHVVRVQGGSALAPFSLEVPGDPSQAAFLVVAALVVPGSEVVVEQVYVGPGRAGFVDVLLRMGADIEIVRRDATTADLVVRHSALRATEVRGAEVPDCIDEIPVLAVAACFAEGTTVFADAAELRVKESDRIATTTSELRRIGGDVEATEDGMVVRGGGLDPRGTVRSHGDHRIAMALAVAGLAGGPGSTLDVDGFAAVETSWPGFLDTVASLR